MVVVNHLWEDNVGGWWWVCVLGGGWRRIREGGFGQCILHVYENAMKKKIGLQGRWCTSLLSLCIGWRCFLGPLRTFILLPDPQALCSGLLSQLLQAQCLNVTVSRSSDPDSNADLRNSYHFRGRRLWPQSGSSKCAVPHPTPPRIPCLDYLCFPWVCVSVYAIWIYCNISLNAFLHSRI